MVCSSAALSQCLFDSVGRCGYHADLQRSSGLLFLTEEGNELIVAAKSTFTPSSRRLSEAKSHPELVPPSLSSFPTVTDRLRTATSSGYLGVTLLSDDMVTVLVDEPVEVRINDVLEEIKRAREEDEYFYLVSVEVRWSTTSAFEYTRMSGASSREQVDEEKSVTRWRIHRRGREVKQYSKKFFVTVKNDLQLQSSDLKNTEDTEAIAGVDAQKSRRLENLDTSAMVVELPPLVVDLQAEDPFRLLASDLFSSVAGTSVPFCETSFTIFSLVNLSLHWKRYLQASKMSVRVVTMDADDAVLAVAIIPFSWSVIPRVELSIPSQLLLGAHNILAGELLELILNYSEDFTNASVGIMIANCSSFSILPVGSANSTSEDCSFLLKDAGSSASFSGVTITESQDRAARVGVEVTISQLVHGVDSTTWTLSESSLVSRKVLQGSTAQITIPTMATTNPEIEYISLAVAVNTTDNNIIIKRDGIQYYPLTDDQRYFFLIQRDDAMDSAKRGILSITPNSSFSGILQFAISVSAIGFIDDAIPFQELGVESSTIREVEIEWIPDDEPLEKPVPAGEAIYRSLSTKLQGNATLSFGIKTDVVLNSTEIRQLWSSDSVAVTPSAWKHVEAFIDLSYATSAEIIFRGVVSVDNAVYLKSISIRDYTQESKVGEIEFVRATGGMIYIEVSTAKSIPDPVLLRAHVKEAGSAESTALRFAGKILYRGCAAITTMYPCTDSSGISFTSLSQCRTLCTAVETQLRFTPESIVRSAQMISLSINEAFTVEFWVYLEHLSPSSSDQQLLLLHGSQEGSLSVTLNSYLLISRCQNQLRIPHGLPLETWTHLAIVFGADNEVTVLMNGVEMADGRLSKENCNVPAYAYLQLGRDVYASYETNIVHSDMILVFHFNSVHKTNWYSSGAEGSANNVDFIVQNVRARNSRQIHNFGISGDGKCYYTLSEFTTDEGLDGYICDKNCGDGSGRTCGSNITDNVTSVYGKGPIGVGGLSSLTGYEISVEFVTDESEEYKITNPLIASTSNVTVPGKVDYINAVELSDQQLEIYWSPVDDDGGSEILKYLVFLNGIQVAVNAVGAGPQSNLLALVNAYSDPAPQEPQCSSASSRSGGSVELALDAMTRRTVEELSWILVIEQREASLTSFTTSFYRLNGSLQRSSSSVTTQSTYFGLELSAQLD
ncbi:Immunoglobulin-like fold [Phytophthora cactorum]|nr:Immunoglobulin-like fold [Phytophthora cactorum]